MSGFLYVLIGVLLMMLVLSFFARFFWLFILIYLVIVAVKIIKGIFFTDNPKNSKHYQTSDDYNTYSSNYNQDYSSYHSSNSKGDIIEADYTVIEETENH